MYKSRKRCNIVTKEMAFTTGKYSYKRLRTLKKMTKNHLTITGIKLSKINYYCLRTIFFPLNKKYNGNFVTFTALKYKLHFYS